MAGAIDPAAIEPGNRGDGLLADNAGHEGLTFRRDLAGDAGSSQRFPRLRLNRRDADAKETPAGDAGA
jgi:hypothetical protein